MFLSFEWNLSKKILRNFDDYVCIAQLLFNYDLMI